MITDEDLKLQQHCCENVKSCNSTDVVSEVLIVVLLGIQIFCGVTLCHLGSSSQHVKGSRNLQNVRNCSQKNSVTSDDLNAQDY